MTSATVSSAPICHTGMEGTLQIDTGCSRPCSAGSDHRRAGGAHVRSSLSPACHAAFRHSFQHSRRTGPLSSQRGSQDMVAGTDARSCPARIDIGGCRHALASLFPVRLCPHSPDCRPTFSAPSLPERLFLARRGVDTRRRLHAAPLPSLRRQGGGGDPEQSEVCRLRRRPYCTHRRRALGDGRTLLQGGCSRGVVVRRTAGGMGVRRVNTLIDRFGRNGSTQRAVNHPDGARNCSTMRGDARPAGEGEVLAGRTPPEYRFNP